MKVRLGAQDSNPAHSPSRKELAGLESRAPPPTYANFDCQSSVTSISFSSTMKRELFQEWRRDFGIRIFFFCVVALCMGGSGVFAAGEPAPSSLEAYLQRLGYYPFVLRTDKSDKPLADAELAGKKLTLLVDTGWGITTLRDKMARDLKRLDTSDIRLDDPVMGRLTNSSMAIMEKLTLGKAQFLNQPAKVARLKADYVRILHDGVLGCDFLIRNHCALDCAGNRLYLRANPPRADVSKALGESLSSSGFVDVPVEHQGLIVASAKVNGQPLRMLVDTGSSVSILDDSQKARLRLNAVRWKEAFTGSRIPEEASALLVGVGDTGTTRLTVAKLETLEFGGRKWNDIHLGVADLAAWGIAEKEELADVEGLVGIELIRRSRALIDFSNGKLWMHREEASPAKSSTR